MFGVIMFTVYNNSEAAEKNQFPQAELCSSFGTPTQIPGQFQGILTALLSPPNIFDKIFNFKAAVDE